MNGSGGAALTIPLVSQAEKQEAVAPVDSRESLAGLQLYRASYEKNLPQMAEALAHGAAVNWVNAEEKRSTPLIQAVRGVSVAAGAGCGLQATGSQLGGWLRGGTGLKADPHPGVFVCLLPRALWSAVSFCSRTGPA